MKLTETEVQNIFNTDIEDLKSKNEDDIDFIEQNHFGDLLIEKQNEGTERFKLWRNLNCNDCNIEVEYAGILNNYRWETVAIIELNN